MEPDSIAWTRAACLLLLALWAANVYRAATQAITPDEAITYTRYVGPPLRDSLQRTTANNHVLNTLLARIPTSYFHLTDLALRLPSVLLGGLYLWAVFRLARRTCGAGPMFLAGVGLLSLKPLGLDGLWGAGRCGRGRGTRGGARGLRREHVERRQEYAC